MQGKRFKKSVVMMALMSCTSFSSATGYANTASDMPEERIAPVVQAIRKGLTVNNKLSYCSALKAVKEKPKTQDDLKRRNEAAKIINQKLKNKDAAMIRAQADVYRKGLYGYDVDMNKAYKLYASALKSPDAGFNAALILFNQYKILETKNVQASKQILSVLQKSGALAKGNKGISAAQANYIAGLVNEYGLAGAVNMKAAFENYKVSARNTYVPGVFKYLQLIAGSLKYLSKNEQAVAMQEVGLMSNRWRFYSKDIMSLTGDLHAAKWFPDDEDGFFAQYYWRIAQLMESGSNKDEYEIRFVGKIKKLSKVKEDRLESAVNAARKKIINTESGMEFVDLCVD